MPVFAKRNLAKIPQAALLVALTGALVAPIMFGAGPVSAINPLISPITVTVKARAGSATTINVLANVTAASGVIPGLVSVSTPQHGTATIVAGKVVYTPTRGFHGTDAFTYLVNDGRGGTATGTVNIRVDWVVFLPAIKQ